MEGYIYATEFTHFLPNAHINFDFSEALKLRLSASTGVNRPTYNEWRASAGINVVDKEISGGNPTLEAEESFDLMPRLNITSIMAPRVSGRFYSKHR